MCEGASVRSRSELHSFRIGNITLHSPDVGGGELPLRVGKERPWLLGTRCARVFLPAEYWLCRSQAYW